MKELDLKPWLEKNGLVMHRPTQVTAPDSKSHGLVFKDGKHTGLFIMFKGPKDPEADEVQSFAWNPFRHLLEGADTMSIPMVVSVDDKYFFPFMEEILNRWKF